MFDQVLQLPCQSETQPADHNSPHEYRNDGSKQQLNHALTRVTQQVWVLVMDQWLGYQWTRVVSHCGLADVLDISVFIGSSVDMLSVTLTS